MSVLPRPARAVFVVASLAILTDVLVMQHPVGLGLGVAGTLFAVVVWFARPVLDVRPTSTSRVLAVVLVLTAWIPVVRASPALAFFSMTAVIILGLLGVRVLVTDDLRAWEVGGYVHALGTSALAAVVEPFDFLTKDASFTSRRIPRVLVGLLVAVPILIVFASLFAGADAVFSRMLNDIIDLDLDQFLGHVVTIVILTWAGIGVLRHALRVGPNAWEPGPQPRLAVEATTGLIAIAALFAVFVVVQFAYLFGGLETNTGLTYAEYARKGFFELVTVAGLVVLLSLVVERLVQGTQRSRAVDVALSVLVVETLVVLASAVVRLNLYVDAFGLTEARLYAAVFLIWAGVVLLLIVGVMLRGKRATFAFAAFVTGVVLLLAVSVANPDGIIARTNLMTNPVDVDYLATLSADAVPSLIGQLEPDVLCDMVEPRGDWRSDRIAEARGRRALTAAGVSCDQ